MMAMIVVAWRRCGGGREWFLEVCCPGIESVRWYGTRVVGRERLGDGWQYVDEHIIYFDLRFVVDEMDCYSVRVDST